MVQEKTVSNVRPTSTEVLTAYVRHFDKAASSDQAAASHCQECGWCQAWVTDWRAGVAEREAHRHGWWDRR